MGVHMDAHALAAARLDALDDVIGGLRFEQRRHVFEADGVATQLQQALGHLDKGLGGVQRADGVANRALGVLAVAPHRLDRLLDIADVVERVKDAKHIHTVFGRLVDKAVHHGVFVMAVAQQVLRAQQHLQTRVGQQRAELSQALPGVFVEKADAGVEGRATPAFNRPVAGPVDISTGRHHVLHRHAGGQQALVRVAQAQFGDVYGFGFSHG